MKILFLLIFLSACGGSSNIDEERRTSRVEAFYESDDQSTTECDEYYTTLSLDETYISISSSTHIEGNFIKNKILNLEINNILFLNELNTCSTLRFYDAFISLDESIFTTDQSGFDLAIQNFCKSYSEEICSEYLTQVEIKLEETQEAKNFEFTSKKLVEAKYFYKLPGYKSDWIDLNAWSFEGDILNQLFIKELSLDEGFTQFDLSISLYEEYVSIEKIPGYSNLSLKLPTRYNGQKMIYEKLGQSYNYPQEDGSYLFFLNARPYGSDAYIEVEINLKLQEVEVE